MLSLVGLQVVRLGGVAGFGGFSAPSDQRQGEYFLVPLRAAALLRMIIRDVHHGEARCRRLNLRRLVSHHLILLLIRRCGGALSRGERIVIPTRGRRRRDGWAVAT